MHSFVTRHLSGGHNITKPMSNRRALLLKPRTDVSSRIAWGCEWQRATNDSGLNKMLISHSWKMIGSPALVRWLHRIIRAPSSLLTCLPRHVTSTLWSRMWLRFQPSQAKILKKMAQNRHFLEALQSTSTCVLLSIC